MVRSIVGAGASSLSRGHGAGYQASASTVTASESMGRSSRIPSQPPVSLAGRAAERRLAEAGLHDHPLRERRRRGVAEPPPRFVRRACGRHLGHRRLVEQRSRPGLRVRREREAEQLPVLLEPPAHAAQRAAGALHLRSDRHRAGLGRAQEVHRRRARLALGVGHRQLEPAHHDRHHVAAERPARRVPAVDHRALPDAVAERAQGGVVVEGQRRGSLLRRRTSRELLRPRQPLDARLLAHGVRARRHRASTRRPPRAGASRCSGSPPRPRAPEAALHVRGPAAVEAAVAAAQEVDEGGGRVGHELSAGYIAASRAVERLPVRHAVGQLLLAFDLGVQLGAE